MPRCAIATTPTQNTVCFLGIDSNAEGRAIVCLNWGRVCGEGTQKDCHIHIYMLLTLPLNHKLQMPTQTYLSEIISHRWSRGLNFARPNNTCVCLFSVVPIKASQALFGRYLGGLVGADMHVFGAIIIAARMLICILMFYIRMR